jgi:hypothetical protein
MLEFEFFYLTFDFQCQIDILKICGIVICNFKQEGTK